MIKSYNDRVCGTSGKPGWRVRAQLGLVGLVMAAGVSGCHSVKESTPRRTATEELLLSSAADNAIGTMNLFWLAGRRVFLEEQYFESYDKGYAVGLIRERLSVSGALLVNREDKADVIVEIRSGVLSMDSSGTLVGLPAMTVPIPLTGPLQTPEIGFYTSKLSDSVAKVALFAYERDSGRYLRSAGPMEGRAHLHLYNVLFVSWRRTDVPEFSGRGKRKSPQFEAVPDPQPEEH
jgi:hypothetical protein